MTDDRLSQAIKEARSVCPSNEVELSTLEIIHPSFVDDLGNPTSIRVVRNHADLDTWRTNGGTEVNALLDALPEEEQSLVGLVSRLEASAPLNPGELTHWIALWFEMDNPTIDDRPVPEISIRMDNVSREITRAVSDAATSNDYVKVIFRPYLASNPYDGPEMDPPLVFVLTQVHADVSVIQATGRQEDFGLLSYPSKLYNTTKHPGLIQ